MSKDKFAKGAIIGSIIGAAIGLLFAPKSGEETRRQLKQEADKLKKKPEVKKAIATAKEVSKKYTPIVKKKLNKANAVLKQISSELEKKKK